MAIAFANLGASSGLGAGNATNPDINSATNATSYANSSWTPPGADLIVVFVTSRRGSSNGDTPTISGNSLTWTQIGATLDVDTNHGLSLFGANAAGSATGVTTVDFGANTQDHCIVSFFQATGVDLTGGVAAAFVQNVNNTGSATSGSATLAAAGASANRPISGFVHATNEVASPRANWTELDDMHGSNAIRDLITQYRDDAFETTASATWSTSAAWGGIAAELLATVTGHAGSLVNSSRLKSKVGGGLVG